MDIGERLRQLDERAGVARPRTPPEWSPRVGALVPLAEQLVVGRRAAGLAAVGLLVVALLLAPGQLWLPAALLVVGGAGLLLGRAIAPDVLPRRAVSLARPVAADVPRRRASRAAGWSAAAAVVALPVVLALALSPAYTPFAAAPAVSGPLVMATGWWRGWRRASAQLAEWERERGVEVLAPVGLRNPARGGLYVAPRVV